MRGRGVAAQAYQGADDDSRDQGGSRIIGRYIEPHMRRANRSGAARTWSASSRYPRGLIVLAAPRDKICAYLADVTRLPSDLDARIDPCRRARTEGLRT
jgi:hypothetical protein